MACSETSTSSTEPFLQVDSVNESVNYASATNYNFPPDPSTLSFDPNEAPPPYSSEPNWRLTYVDFTPRCLDAGGILSSPKFDTFAMLVAKANSYLLRHPATCVKCMETTKFTVRDVRKPGVVVDTRVPTLSDAASTTGYLVQALRMWIMPKQADSATQVGYLNVVPACLDPGGILKKPLFDTLAKTVKKLNALLEKTPLPGRIMNIETVQMPFRQYRTWIEPDRCHWRQYKDISSSHVSFLRLHYEACDSPHPTKIGYKDFIPQEMSRTHRLLHRTEKFESIHDLSHHAGAWLKEQHDLTTLNIETTHYKIKKDGKRVKADTEESLSIQYGSARLLQCLRVWFANQEHRSATVTTLDSSLQCRMFCPEQLVGGGMFSSPVFESMMETRQRLKNWTLTYDDIPMVSAETVYVKLHSGVPEELWSAITHHRGNLDYHSMWITVLRVYVWFRDSGARPPIDVGIGSYQNELLNDIHECSNPELDTSV